MTEFASPTQKNGRMLMVVPSNIESHSGQLMVDGDFAQYLRLYLDEFENITIACPLAAAGTFPTLEPLNTIPNDGRLRFIVLPQPYREDRYILSIGRVRRLLSEEIRKSDFVVVAPHSAFDWPTLAADICIRTDKPYNMEGDWNLQQVNWEIWRNLPVGLNKLRRYFWMKLHDPLYFRAMRNSRVALLHGHDVFEAYKDIAPNPHVVNNFRVTKSDRISPEELNSKLNQVIQGEELNIVYAGRAAHMKGPMDWLETMKKLKAIGVKFKATWYGDGDLLPAMQIYVSEHDLSGEVCLAGNVDRKTVFKHLFQAHLFAFCHLTRESPRNLVEALAAGVPIVGYGTSYAEHLVKDHGGGNFVRVNAIDDLVREITMLNNNRDSLGRLISKAALSGTLFDRNASVKQRTSLMKQYLLQK